MRLIELKVENFRCFSRETRVPLNDITVFVGMNDSGKSSLLDAMEIFFDEKRSPENDDCCVHTSDSLVKITCVFDSFPEDIIVDEQHLTDLASEYLLNGEGHLEITKVYNCASGKGKLTGVFASAIHPSSDNYCDLLMLTNAKLKQRASELGVDLNEANQSINSELRCAIWGHASELDLKDTKLELKTEDSGRIWDQLKNYLPIFALFKSDRPSTDQDSEAQDPMKAAIKEAIKNQERVLDTITEEVKREVQDIADLTVEKIREMDRNLASELNPRVANKSWESIFSVSLTGDDEIPINKRGSGTRRLVLLSFFRAKAERESEGSNTGIIYAIEEPETSQHPNNQKILIKAFEDLSQTPGCQVFLTTHTPVLSRHFPQDCLRFLTNDEDGQLIVRSGCDEQTLEDIRDSLGILPDHNIRAFLGVEGRNDIEYLCSISAILRDAGEDLPSLRDLEDRGELVFIPLGGSSMDLWLSRLEGLNVPEFYLIDRDNPPPQEARYQSIADSLRERGCTVWITNKRELENYIHPDLITDLYAGYLGNGEEFEDVPMLLAQAIHEASESDQTWEEISLDVDKLNKKISRAKRRLCKEIVCGMNPELLNAIDPDNEIRTWLGELATVFT